MYATCSSPTVSSSPRDEGLVSLERLNTRTVAAIARTEDRATVATFAAWRVLHHARRRADHNTTGRTAIRHARNQTLAAVRFLDWLAGHDLTLAACTQRDLDLWLATGPRSRYDVRHFTDWTSDRKLSTTLKVPPVYTGPGGVLDAETRWTIIAKAPTRPRRRSRRPAWPGASCSSTHNPSAASR